MQTQNLPAELSNLGTALLAQGQNATSGQAEFMKFKGREGVWLIGQDEFEPEEDSLWAANPMSIMHGLVCWKDGKVAGEEMVPAGQAAPAASAMPDHGVDSEGVQTTWNKQMAVQLKCLSGEDEGMEVIYKMSTYGGVKSIEKLSGTIGKEIISGSTDVVPVCKLTSESYPHKKYGKLYNPIFEVQKWIGMDGVDTSNGVEDDDDAPFEEEVVSSPKSRSRKRRK